MKYTKIIVYYFSGTGNAKQAAEWIVAFGNNLGLESKLVNISDTKGINISEYRSNVLLGFCYPTHGFNAPPVVLKFINNFPKGESDVFLLNTRAGMKLYKIFTPGLSGLALLTPALLLKLKGFRIRAYRPIDLPSNWISVHPGLKRKVVESIFSRCKKIIDTFSEKIMAGKRVSRGLLSLPIDLAISPVALAYYFYGRFGLAKTFFASSECNNCGICIKNCPVKAITLVDNRYYWTFSCESCMKCMNNCPKNAIQTAHAFTFLIWWLIFSIIPYAGIKLLLKYEVLNSAWISQNYNLIFNLIILATGLLIVFSGYRIMHFLLRFRVFNFLISYSSLTRYAFWRRYKAP
ncbi:MAG: EFR1 family ferrodoxin [Bacteroidales bacterium]|nr:EFR1 family ferrodoxin [Bacteroidales bacterium]MCF8391248.1 EFR1 family ferrodoxin [Bacteroidales bacterium]